LSDNLRVETTGIIAIVRGDYAERIQEITSALYEGGVRVVEVTMNSAGALGMIRALSNTFQGRMLIGAGTVLTEDQLSAAASAGATFSVSPDTFPPLIERALKLGIEPFPGAYTPTEVRTAIRAGARYIKLFPAMPAGPDYLKQLRAPLHDVRFVPTGGISEADVTDFIHAGATALGFGGSLIPRIFDGSDAALTRIRESAGRLVALVAQARN
jgi:2-dehydro-3-deoxyphosphogluconate aldolase/(4S)-4-hydroxy-2-oxoglutarate aldolase